MFRKIAHFIVALICTVGLTFSQAAPRAQAQTCDITVTDGGDSGPGTLRQAMADISSGGTICLLVDVTINTPIDIFTNVTIDGENHLIEAGYGTAIKNVSGSILNLIHITVNGYAPAIEIDFSSTINVTNSTINATINTISSLRDSAVNINNSVLNGAANTLDIEMNSSLSVINSTVIGTNYTLFMAYNSNAIIENSTFIGSLYAIYLDDASAIINNSTIMDTGNQTALSWFTGASVSLRNNIISSCDSYSYSTYAPVVNINNFSSNGSCGATYSGDALLGPLQDNGGSTFTMMPACDSPVIDAADAATSLSTDQLGASRPQGAGYDIGAVEFQGTPCPPTPTPTNTPTATNTPLPTSTLTPTPTNAPLPTNTLTPLPTDTPTPLPTDTPTAIPIPPTDTPTPTPTSFFLPTATPLPLDTPTPAPTPTGVPLSNDQNSWFVAWAVILALYYAVQMIGGTKQH